MYDKARIEVKLKNSIYDIEFALYHNINLLTGVSGGNKTHLLELLLEYSDDEELILTGIDSKGNNVEYSIISINSETELNNLSLNGYNLIIVDDILTVVYSAMISRICKENPDVIFLIAARDNNLYSDNNKEGKLSCFGDAVFNVKYSVVGEEERVETFRLVRLIDENLQYVSASKERTDLKNSIEIAVIEGSVDAMEWKFFKNLFKTVEGSCGKDNIVTSILTLGRENKGDYAIVIVDFCAIGLNLEEIIYTMKIEGNLLLSLTYSIEYSIVSAVSPEKKLIEYNNINSDTISGMFFEEYFYHELVKIQFGKCGKCTKGQLVKCLTDECSNVCNIPQDYRNSCNLYGTTLSERVQNLCIKDMKDVFYLAKGGKVTC